MRLSFAFIALFAPLVALAQNNASSASSGNNGGNATSQSIQVSTSFSQGISFDGNRQPHTISTPVLISITPAPAPTGNSTNSTTGNSTSAANSTSSKPTSTGPLPTAPTDVDGGGNGEHGAPVPGQSGANGVYGPGDGYTTNAAALPIEGKAILVSIAGMILGGLLVFV
ncbi:hypothetical protein DENSPDRAFT_384032 [Dentipellis sp. KUC8613]|nr:hypothetical protein DENSPDRAFT_384032 [Dentipellis sp. KUC8613]